MVNLPDWSFEEFLSMTTEDIRHFSPQTIIYSVSGTRRRAALANISPYGKEYTSWTRYQMMNCLNVIFDHGVSHVLMPMLTPSQFSEVTPSYRENLWQWLNEGLQSKDFVLYCQSKKIKVHIPFIEYVPWLQSAHATLVEQTHHQEFISNLWVFIIPEHNILWQWSLNKLHDQLPESTDKASQLLYGSDVPPATMYIDFGKPIVSPDLLPPFLTGKLECYWTQRPGYSLDEEQFRRILYDYAYVRKTWREDKTGRAEEAKQYRQAWEEGPILGLGERLGPYWYPQPTIIPGVTAANDQKNGSK